MAKFRIMPNGVIEVETTTAQEFEQAYRLFCVGSTETAAKAQEGRFADAIDREIEDDPEERWSTIKSRAAAKCDVSVRTLERTYGNTDPRKSVGLSD